MNLQEIEKALAEGKRVYCGQPGVWVFRLPSGELVVGDPGYFVGLVRRDGTLNGKTFGVI